MPKNPINNLRDLRLACKISQAELGRMFKPAINFATISKIENGIRDLPVSYTKQLSVILQSLQEFHGISKKINRANMR